MNALRLVPCKAEPNTESKHELGGLNGVVSGIEAALVVVVKTEVAFAPALVAIVGIMLVL
jgi:hypothetical protein